MSSSSGQPSHRATPPSRESSGGAGSDDSSDSVVDILASPLVGRIGTGAALLGGLMWVVAAVLVALGVNGVGSLLIFPGLLVLFVALVISGLGLDPSAKLEARVAISATLAVGVMLIWVLALTLLRNVLGMDNDTGTVIALVVGGIPAMALGLMTLRRRRGVTGVANGIG